MLSSKEIIKLLQEDGWYKVDQSGSHVQFKHGIKTGRVTVPHPKKDIPVKTFKSIERQAGIQLKK
jgi:predicted RNA binding protein YcfA (HicA-like mRNA interferase family)